MHIEIEMHEIPARMQHAGFQLLEFVVISAHNNHAFRMISCHLHILKQPLKGFAGAVTGEAKGRGLFYLRMRLSPVSGLGESGLSIILRDGLEKACRHFDTLSTTIMPMMNKNSRLMASQVYGPRGER